MSDYFRTIVSYINENRIEMLPHVFVSFFIIPFWMVPESVFKTLAAMLFPIFGIVLAIRAFIKTDKDGLEIKYRYFIIFALPVLIAMIFFFFGPIIYLLIVDFFGRIFN